MEQADTVVFGDSFAFGYGVDDTDHFANHVPRHAVKAIASPAYSMVHGLLWMERLADRLADKTVIWLVYSGNDLVDNLRPAMATYRMLFVREHDGTWEIVTDHVSPTHGTSAARSRPTTKPWSSCAATPTSRNVPTQRPTTSSAQHPPSAPRPAPHR
jgi:hypothetical protein